MDNGYSKSELYITTWGYGDDLRKNETVHNEENVMYVRKFFEAVFAYTGAEKIDVITHSLGGTLARRVIKGGLVNAAL